jgi:hypothetical protein
VQVSQSDGLIFGDDYLDGITVETKWGVKEAVKDSFSEFKVHYKWIWESEKKFFQIKKNNL